MSIVKKCPCCNYIMFQGKDLYECNAFNSYCDEVNNCYIKELQDTISRYKQYLDTEIEVNSELSDRLYKIKIMITSNDNYNYFNNRILKIIGDTVEDK